MSVVDFARAKRASAKTAADWTPEDALVDALEDIREGRAKPTSLMVLYWEEDEDKTIHPHYVYSGPGGGKKFLMLEVAKQQAWEEWRG
jgi:hypothetical protein